MISLISEIIQLHESITVDLQGVIFLKEFLQEYKDRTPRRAHHSVYQKCLMMLQNKVLPIIVSVRNESVPGPQEGHHPAYRIANTSDANIQIHSHARKKTSLRSMNIKNGSFSE